MSCKAQPFMLLSSPYTPMNIHRRSWTFVCILLAIALHGCDNGPTDVEEVVQGVTIQGIDISHHNIDSYEAIDWRQVSESGYTFAFVKATDGYNSCWTDPTFTGNMGAG
jgi:hypothetical protein